MPIRPPDGCGVMLQFTLLQLGLGCLVSQILIMLQLVEAEQL